MNYEHFIKANTQLVATALTPEILLHVADDVTALWQMSESALNQIGLPPPFWAFAWPGGQALARYLLDNPGIVAGKRVLDFATGSGLVAIAAARAGAAHVEACDIDPFATAAARLNAEANDVLVEARLDDLVGSDGNWDVVLAGDVSYERDMAARVTHWLGSLSRRGALVLIGDPGRTYLAKDQLVQLVEYLTPVSRDLEDTDVKIAKVWGVVNRQ